MRPEVQPGDHELSSMTLPFALLLTLLPLGFTGLLLSEGFRDQAAKIL